MRYNFALFNYFIFYVFACATSCTTYSSAGYDYTNDYSYATRLLQREQTAFNTCVHNLPPTSLPTSHPYSQNNRAISESKIENVPLHTNLILLAHDIIENTQTLTGKNQIFSALSKPISNDDSDSDDNLPITRAMKKNFDDPDWQREKGIRHLMQEEKNEPYEKDTTYYYDEAFTSEIYSEESQKWLTDALSTGCLLTILNIVGGPFGLSYIFPFTKRLIAGYAAPLIVPIGGIFFYFIERCAPYAHTALYGDTRHRSFTKLKAINAYTTFTFWNYTIIKSIILSIWYMQLMRQHLQKETYYTKIALLTNWATIAVLLFPYMDLGLKHSNELKNSVASSPVLYSLDEIKDKQSRDYNYKSDEED